MYHIYLDTPYPQLLLPCNSGVTFEAQTGGMLCSHHKVEGMLLPLPVSNDQDPRRETDLIRLADKLENIHPGCCQIGITDEEADQLDTAFVACNMPLIADRTRLQESTEAWLYVKLREKDERWRPAKSEEEITGFIEAARKWNRFYDPETTDASIRKTYDEARAGLEELNDFAGMEAILTWANCD